MRDAGGSHDPRDGDGGKTGGFDTRHFGGGGGGPGAGALWLIVRMTREAVMTGLLFLPRIPITATTARIC